MMKRAGNTGREMVESGAWVKVGRKHYRHESGAEVRYNHNRYAWEVIVGGVESSAWGLLWVARHNVETGRA